MGYFFEGFSWSLTPSGGMLKHSVIPFHNLDLRKMPEWDIAGTNQSDINSFDGIKTGHNLHEQLVTAQD